MADNITLNAGTGGDTVAADDISGVKHQRVKVGFGADGSYGDVARTSLATRMPVASLFDEIVLNEASGYAQEYVFGRHRDLDISEGWRAIFDDGTGTNAYAGHSATAAESIRVLSTSTADDLLAAGTGALTITVEGLDASGNAQTVNSIILDGVAPVNISGSWTRVNRVYVTSVGTGGQNAGLLTVYGATSAVVYANVPIGFNVSQNATYTVPNGKTAHLFQWWIELGNAVTGFVQGRLSTRLTGAGKPFAPADAMTVVSAASTRAVREFKYPLILPALTEVQVRALTSVDDAIVNAGFNMLIVDD